MEPHDQQFRPDPVDEQEIYGMYRGEQQEQWLTSGMFGAPAEYKEQADRASVEQVWGRMVEHLANNSSIYQHNKNLQARSQKRRAIKSRPSRKETTKSWQGYLGNAAALLVLALIVGSMVLVLHTAHQNSTITGSGPQTGSDTNPGVITIKIIYGKDGLPSFSTGKVIAHANTTIIWQNTTSQAQTVLNETNTSGAKIAANMVQKMPLPNNEGVTVYHLTSNPKAQIGISVISKSQPLPQN